MDARGGSDTTASPSRRVFARVKYLRVESSSNMPGLSCGTRRPSAYLCGALYRGRVPRHVSARAKTHRNAPRNVCVNAHVARRRASEKLLRTLPSFINTTRSSSLVNLFPKQGRDARRRHVQLVKLSREAVSERCFNFSRRMHRVERHRARARARARARKFREIIVPAEWGMRSTG